MARIDLLLDFVTVIGISCGQLVFKYSAGRLPWHPSLLDWSDNGYL